MHIAFNRIHPETYKIHHPSHDFGALEPTYRAVEAQYDLKDKGRSDAAECQQKPVKARDMEAHTWEQSFAGYVQGLFPNLEAKRIAAKTWQDLHAGFGEYGLQMKLKGNGLIIADAKHKGQDKLWKKYRSGRTGKSGLLKTAYRNWRLFLQAEAINDPLAMAVIIAQRQMIRGITRTGGRSR